ncbi:hypothetical protein ES702_02325 [subsurface metagenome]
MEKEEKLYARYSGNKPPSVSVDDLSDSLSELSSVSLPPSSDNDQHEPAFMEQSIHSIKFGLPVLEGLNETIETGLKDAPLEPGIPSFTPSHNGPNDSLQMLLNSRLESKSPSLERPGMSDISLLAKGAVDQSLQALTAPGRMLRSSETSITESRLRQYGVKQTPGSLSYLGSWVTDNMKDIYLANLGSTKEILTQEYVPTSAYSVTGMTRWPAYGAPWSWETAGNRNCPERLPDGAKTFQEMTIRKYESLAFGLPMSGQLDLIRSLISEDARETRSLLLYDWLWETDARFDHTPNMELTTGQAAARTPDIQSGRLTWTTIANYSDSGGLIYRKDFPSLPITARNTNPIRSNLAFSRKSF